MTWPLPRIFAIPLALLLSLAPGLAYDHPGAPYTRRDLETAKTRAASGKSPWVEARKNLLEEADEALKLTVTPAPERLVIPRRYVDNAGHTKAREKIGAVPVETSQRTLKGAKANVTFDLPGTYRIQLTAIDDAGAAATREFSLVVEP